MAEIEGLESEALDRLSGDMQRSPENARRKIAVLEAVMKQIDGHLGEDPFPLKHTFTPGIYCREILAPKGMLIITKLHKTEHPVFMLKGEVSILTEDGVKRLKAPCMIISPVGAKRVVYIHEDTVWINVHANPEDITDLKVLEDRLIAKNYAELGLEDPVISGGMICLGA